MRIDRLKSVTMSLACSAAMLALVTANGAAQASQRYSLGGGDVAVWNLVGSIRVESGRGSETEVEVTRRGPDASRLRVETGRLRGRESLRVIYPDRRIVFATRRGNGFFDNSRMTLSVNDDGTFGGNSDWFRGDRVEIRSSGSGLEASADVRITIPRGTRIEVHLAAGEATVSNVDGDISVDVHAATVTTNGTRGALSLDTGSGEVSVTDADGELSVDSGSGSVQLTRVHGANINLDAGSGSVTAADLTAEHLSLDGGSGKAVLRAVRARDVGLDTGSGSVELQLVADVDRLQVDAGSGSVTIGLPESLGATVEVETGSGGVDFDFPISVTKRSRHYIAGQVGDGRGRITVDSGSGAVRFRRS